MTTNFFQELPSPKPISANYQNLNLTFGGEELQVLYTIPVNYNLSIRLRKLWNSKLVILIVFEFSCKEANFSRP